MAEPPVDRLDPAVASLHDPIIALQRQALGVERIYRALARNDDLVVDSAGEPSTPAESIAALTDALAAMRKALGAAERHRATAHSHAARLRLDRG